MEVFGVDKGMFMDGGDVEGGNKNSRYYLYGAKGKK